MVVSNISLFNVHPYLERNIQFEKHIFILNWLKTHQLYEVWNCRCKKNEFVCRSFVPGRVVHTDILPNVARSIAKTCTIGCMLDLDVTWANVHYMI